MEIGPLYSCTYANDLKLREKDDCVRMVYNTLLRLDYEGHLHEYSDARNLNSNRFLFGRNHSYWCLKFTT